MDFDKLMKEVKTNERQKRLEKSLLFHGIFNIAFPILNILLISVWGSIMLSLLKATNPSTFFIIPIFFPPISAFIGIIRGIKNKKNKNAKKCIFLSILSLFLYIAIFALIIYGASRFHRY